MSATGHLTEYPVPTSNAGVDGITAANDGSLWFTETLANKVGRIDLQGHITESTVPTPNSYPQAISAPPSGASCNPHAIWFAEVNAKKIAEITY